MNSLIHHKSTSHGVAYAILASLLVFAPLSWSADNPIWISVGPYGGSISCIAIDPLAPTTLYAGTRGGGIFKSSDRGASWTAVNRGLTQFYILDIAVNPTNSGTLYTATYTVVNSGLFKSTNGGQSWTPIDSGLPELTVVTIAIDPAQTDTVYVGTAIRGVYKSTDGGNTWAAVNTGIPDKASIVDLEFDRRNPGIVYAGTGHDGVFKTENGGQTWTAVNTGLPSLSLNTLIIDPKDPNVLYAGIIGFQSTGIWKTVNGGSSWNPVAGAGLPSFNVVAELVIDPGNPKTIYVVGFPRNETLTSIYKSGDGGDTWIALTEVPDTGIAKLAIDSQNSSTIFAGSASAGPSGPGMYKSTDAGKTWILSSRGLSAVGVYGLTVDHSNPGTVYAGTDRGVYKSTDGGSTWSRKRSDTTGPVSIDPNNSATIYTIDIGDVLKSTDGGETWRHLDGIHDIYVLAIDPNNPKTLYGGISNQPYGPGSTSTGVYRTDDGGETWRPANGGLPTGRDTFSFVAVDPKNSATVYTAVLHQPLSPDGGAFYRTTDGGGTWKQVGAERPIKPLAIDTEHEGTLYAVTPDKGLLKTVDGGDSWIQIGAAPKYISALAVEGSASVLCASTPESEVFRSTDSGSSWTLLGNGPAMPAVYSLAIDPRNLETAYAGTDGGVFKLVPLVSAYQVAVPMSGAAVASTAGIDGPVQSGYATIAVDSNPIASGTAVFSFRQNGVVASEAGVPASSPTRSARIFVEYRTGVKAAGLDAAGSIDVYTGLALVNGSSSSANVTYTLRNVSGAVIAGGHGILAAGAHFASFVNQLPDQAPDFKLPDGFPTAVQFGSLDIASDQPLSVLALRLTINQRNEALLTTTPTADLTQPVSGGRLFFPQFVDGGCHATKLILLNTSGLQETGTISFYDGNGAPLIIKQAGGDGSSSFPYSIPPGGVFVFQSSGTPLSLSEGSMQLTPDAATSTPAGAGVFSVLKNGILVSESGIPAAKPTMHARIYVDLSGGHDTGLAIANTTNTDAVIYMTAFQSDGVTGIGASKGPLPLPARGHSAHFVGEFIDGFPAGFTGVLDIICPSNPFSYTPFAALTLRSLDNERHDFLLTTLPVADMTAPAPTSVVFPQIADGDGYVTQFILLGAAGASKASLKLWNNVGIPLAVGKP